MPMVGYITDVKGRVCTHDSSWRPARHADVWRGRDLGGLESPADLNALCGPDADWLQQPHWAGAAGRGGSACVRPPALRDLSSSLLANPLSNEFGACVTDHKKATDLDHKKRQGEIDGEGEQAMEEHGNSHHQISRSEPAAGL